MVTDRIRLVDPRACGTATLDCPSLGTGSGDRNGMAGAAGAAVPRNQDPSAGAMGPGVELSALAK